MKKPVKLIFLSILFPVVCWVIDALQHLADRIYNKGAIMEFNLEKARRKEVLSQEVDKVILESMRQAKILEAKKNK